MTDMSTVIFWADVIRPPSKEDSFVLIVAVHTVLMESLFSNIYKIAYDFICPVSF